MCSLSPVQAEAWHSVERYKSLALRPALVRKIDVAPERNRPARPPISQRPVLGQTSILIPPRRIVLIAGGRQRRKGCTKE